MKKALLLTLLLALTLAVPVHAQPPAEQAMDSVSHGYAALADQHGPYGPGWPVQAKMQLLRLMRDEGLPLPVDRAEEVLDTKISPARQDALATELLAGGGEDADWPLRLIDLSADGWPDLVLITGRGARSTRYDAWLWYPDARRFAPAHFDGFAEGGLWGYTLPHPGLLLDRQQDGITTTRWALYRFDGLAPRLLGRAIIEVSEVTAYEAVTLPEGIPVLEMATPAQTYTQAQHALAAQEREDILLRVLLGLSGLDAYMPAKPPLAQAVIDLCHHALPGWRISAYDGWGNERLGQWALALSMDGRNMLCIVEKSDADSAYAFTVSNERALRPGAQVPSLLIDTGGDSLFFSYTDRQANTAHHYHAVKDEQGRWGDVDMTVFDLAANSEWTMYVHDGMQYGEVLLTDGNDNILARQAYPPQPVPHLAGKTALADFDISLYPERPPEGQTP